MPRELFYGENSLSADLQLSHGTVACFYTGKQTFYVVYVSDAGFLRARLRGFVCLSIEFYF